MLQPYPDDVMDREYKRMTEIQKPLAMGRSPIDRCGLFAAERIEEGEFIEWQVRRCMGSRFVEKFQVCNEEGERVRSA